MKLSFIQTHRLIVLQDGSGDSVLVSLVAEPFSLAMTIDGEELGVSKDVPVFEIDQSKLDEEWNWDEVYAKAAELTRHIAQSDWNEITVRAALAELA